MAHLTKEQRYVIFYLLAKGKKQKEIADIIDRDKSVICREINRNMDQRNGVYKDDLANNKYIARHKNKPKLKRFTPEIKKHVEDLLCQDYSPEQIVGASKDSSIECVSHERIYQHIWQDKKNNGELYTHLRRNDRKYRKRGHLTQLVNINS